MKEKANNNPSGIIKLLSTVVSWTIFVILVICIVLLLYYFISVKIYAAKGPGYEPKFALYTIISPSMTPNIKVYDVVVDTKVEKPEDIKVNDIITFNSSIPELKGGTITHRVISIKNDNGKYYYQTKGDANILEDSELVEYKDVIGRVAIRIPQLGRVQFFIASKIGWLLVVVAPALYIIVKKIFKILHLIKEEDNGKKRGKIVEFLNRPLLLGKKPKLITFNENLAEQQAESRKKDESENNEPSFMTNDSDIDDDDLPSLK